MTIAGQPPLDAADGIARVMGDQALYARMLARFHNDYRYGAAPIRRAIDSGDLHLAHRIVHTVKGASGMIGAPALHGQAIERRLAAERAPAAPLPAQSRVAQLTALLDNGDGAAVDLLETSGASLKAALGEALFAEVTLAMNEFDFEGALKALERAADGERS